MVEVPDSSRELVITNRQRSRAINTTLLRQVIRHLADQVWKLESFQLGFRLVTPDEMACVNETYLQHTGPTDVITFDHTDGANPQRLHGEVFICLAVAESQAREFRTTWQAELARYVIHGLLHLRGHDDLEPTARRAMKREENRLTRLVARQFALSQLERTPRLAP
ncbi:MAG TPA: rRNA maturation RNase YbeY [Verrucomicrobiae bacterium]|nr:rRNA maturation RNase YbeY [Verrucomicrobiae bacterium]